MHYLYDKGYTFAERKKTFGRVFLKIVDNKLKIYGIVSLELCQHIIYPFISTAFLYDRFKKKNPPESNLSDFSKNKPHHFSGLIVMDTYPPGVMGPAIRMTTLNRPDFSF